MNAPFFSTTAPTPQIINSPPLFSTTLEKVDQDEEVTIYRLTLRSERPACPEPLTVRWSLPAHSVQGVWSTNARYEKRLRADWESPTVTARVAVEAPVLSLFGHDDYNVLTFACSEAIHPVELAAPVREEDNLIYAQLRFFTEAIPLTDYYQTDIRVDERAVLFSEVLADVARWWASYDTLTPATVPEAAHQPVYSTWYAYHQNVSTESIIAECRQAAALGYGTVIIDDGWQTLDDQRGYDYVGDWRPERLPDLAELVPQVHALGMNVMTWYAVPFCGPKSQAYARFQDKLLTRQHRWAPVLDPRYPEVRTYLINTYVRALEDYRLDGFKLDFIDEFRRYPTTEVTAEGGRDYASVDEAVDRLMSDAYDALQTRRPDVLIEFRQRYVGPAMRRYGTMFRAFDCPHDSTTNRVRTTDVRLLCGTSAVHSDMLTWHPDEPVELAALQFVNVLFSVPQLSVRLAEQSDEHRRMIAFYTRYWNEHRNLLMNGTFRAYRPLANYPVLSVTDEERTIIGVYEDLVVNVEDTFLEIDFVNGKLSEQVAFELYDDAGKCSVNVYDCQGQLDWCEDMELAEGMHALEVPPAGLIQIKLLS